MGNWSPSTSVLATAKHYVADGGTELRAVHLPPYTAAIGAGVGSVMTSHLPANHHGPDHPPSVAERARTTTNRPVCGSLSDHD